MTAPDANTLCRDCGWIGPGEGLARCPECHSRRYARHAEIATLALAHLDCDAFYASIEKRDRPELIDQPVIVGGGKRGVVSACCYVARRFGIHSAMPMFKAVDLCPQAVVIKPDMAKYVGVSRQVREILLSVTPLVEAVSIDEAFLDLSGTELIHRGPPARTLALLVKRLEDELGVPASIGLSFNKFLAKLASDLDKPRGFAVIGRDDALDRLAVMPVGRIWGVGKQLEKQLQRDGIATIGGLQMTDQATLMRRYGVMGQRLYRLARAEDDRTVTPVRAAKSVSAETTLEEDVSDPEILGRHLWLLAEKVARRMKASNLGGKTLTLKLKTKDFKTRTRAVTLAAPTQLAVVIWEAAKPLLALETTGTRFRLIGVGLSHLVDAAQADPPDLIDRRANRQGDVERALDAVRAKLGQDAIVKGLALRPKS